MVCLGFLKFKSSKLENLSSVEGVKPTTLFHSYQTSHITILTHRWFEEPFIRSTIQGDRYKLTPTEVL